MSTLHVENLKGPTSGANANKIIVPSGQELTASGHVVQVVSNKAATYFQSTSTSYVETATDIRTTITPKYSNSKILFHCGLGIGAEESGSHDAQVSYKLYDHTASADVSNTESKLRCYDYGGNGLYMQVGANFTIQIDSWGTTAKTFTYYVKKDAGIRVRMSDENKNTYMTIMEIAA